jgi:hypothetical protein
MARLARFRLVRVCAGLALAALLGGAARASGTHAAPPDSGPGAFISPHQPVRASNFWWPAVVLERGSTYLSSVRSVDETRFGLALAYRTPTLSPHLRALISPSLGAYHNLAGMAGAGLRAHFELAGVPLSYGIGLHLEARLRDSLWLSYATPIEIGASLHRGTSAEHFVFVGARRTWAGELINSYLLDPNGYDNQAYADRLSELREDRAWQLYVSFVFGRRVE